VICTRVIVSIVVWRVISSTRTGRCIVIITIHMMIAVGSAFGR